MKKIAIVFLSVRVLIGFDSYGQSSKEKAESIAAEFNKTKHKVKEKNGVKTESHTVVEAAPDIRENVTSYAGKYELGGFGHYIVLRQSADNKLEGEYFKSENNKEIKLATLKDIRVESALLTATIQHANGRSAGFEGVFINRIENGEKSYGLGIRQLLELPDGFTLDKAFYKRTE